MRNFLIICCLLAGSSLFASIPVPIESANELGFLKYLSATFNDVGEKELIAALLCIIIGYTGAHWFYLGNTTKGRKRLFAFLGALGLYIGGYIALLLGAASGALALIYAGYATLIGGAVLIFINWILTIFDLIEILT